MQYAISVPFNNQTITAFVHNDMPYIAMKPIVENMGLAWGSQLNRIKRHPILSKGIFMMNTPSEGGLQETLCLPLTMLNGWLFGIDSCRVKADIRDKVIAYQEKCFDVLANYFGMSSRVQEAPQTELSRQAQDIEMMIRHLVPIQLKAVLELIVKYNDHNQNILAVQLRKHFA